MNICPGCGADNQCAVSAGKAPESCWCFRLPFGLAEQAALPQNADCYCELCLLRILKTHQVGKSDRQPE